MSSNSRIQLENWLKTIDVKADRVLDIGGSQLPIKGRTRSWDVGYCRILDLEQPHEIKRQPDVMTDIQTCDFIRDEFNVVFCIEVSEYWYDPLSALRNINNLLKQGGVLYISFHFLYPIHKPSGLDYLRYTEHGARKLLAEAGFETVEFVYKNFNSGAGELGRSFGLEGMRPDKDYQQHIGQGYLVKAIKK